MRFKRTILILLIYLLWAPLSLKAQRESSCLFSIDTPAVLISTDNLDQIYAVTNKNQLLKYSRAGKLLWNYSDKSLGALKFIDTTDPMRILLFYPDLQQAVVLNNNLNEISRFNFADNPDRFITLIATANSNGYWIYDQQNRRLQKLSNQFTDELSGPDIFLQSGITPRATGLKTSDQYLFLLSAGSGILQFDRFGAFMRLLQLGSIENFQVKEGFILFKQDQKWKRFDTGNLTTSIMLDLDPEALEVSEGNNIRVLRYANRIDVYEKLPAN